MAGPKPMALGAHQFEALGFGYAGVKSKLDTPWAEVETAGRLNALQWTGPSSESITINGAIFPKQYGGASSLEGIKLAARTGVPLMLVTGGGAVFGLHAVQSVEEDQSYHDRDGTPGKNAYTIELKRLDDAFSLVSAIVGLF